MNTNELFKKPFKRLSSFLVNKTKQKLELENDRSQMWLSATYPLLGLTYFFTITANHQ